MRHAVILAHPDPQSFNAAVARAYVGAVEGLSHGAELRDLYALGFDPRLPLRELPWRHDYEPGPDVVAERAALSGADVLVFVYPLWFNAPPAMLKGYVERVLGMGFGYAASATGTRPLLEDKRLVSISTSGAPDAWATNMVVSMVRAAARRGSVPGRSWPASLAVVVKVVSRSSSGACARRTSAPPGR